MVNGKKSKKASARKTAKEKIVGKIEHVYEKINVVTTTLKSPVKVGDIIHIKGHTTDIVQAIDSIQIEHESVQKAKKGAGIGIKVRGTVRDNDAIYFADKKTAAAFRTQIKAPVFQQAKTSFPSSPRPTLPAAKIAQPPAEKPRFLSF